MHVVISDGVADDVRNTGLVSVQLYNESNKALLNMPLRSFEHAVQIYLIFVVILFSIGG